MFASCSVSDSMIFRSQCKPSLFVLLFLLSLVFVGKCSLWNIADGVLDSFYKSVGDENHDGEYNKDLTSKRVQTILNSTDDVIALGENFSQIGWNDIYRLGAELGQAVLDSVDYGTLQNIMPDLSEYGFSAGYVRKHLKSWNWEKFTDDLIDVSDNGWESTSNSYSEQIDSIYDLVHSYTNFDASEEAKAELPPECFMNVPQMVRYAGYPCAVYTTVTKDGYKLTMHRIPFGSTEAEEKYNKLHSFEDRRRKSRNSRTQRGRERRPVVFLQHGILSDSSCWVTNGPKKSLAFLLADAGFDVWMGNVRGNTYSRSHTSLNPDTDERYWRFSWQQMAEYDLPAMVDAALRVTNQPSLYYVGHSQGTLIAFAKLSEDEAFNKKIKMMFALAPIATLGHINSPVKWFSGLTDVARFGVSLFGGAEVLPTTSLSNWITSKLHKLTEDDALAYHGHNLLLFLVGFNVKRYHQDRLFVFLAQTPSGTSLHNFIHMSQLVSTGLTQKWDYGSEVENIQEYGQSTPPEYDVSKIQSPIALFLGSKDLLADPKDGRMLASKLRNMVHFRMLRGWDHLDFTWGKEAPSMLYEDIIHFIQEKETKKKGNFKPGQPGFRNIRGVDDEL